MKRALFSTCLAGAMALLAIVLSYIVDRASSNPAWSFLTYPPPEFLSGTWNLLLAGVVPGVPYLVVARRAWLTTESCDTRERIAFRAILLLLSVPAFWRMYELVLGTVAIIVAVISHHGQF